MSKFESVDQEILHYFQHLSDLQKQAVLAIVRAFAVNQQDWWKEIQHDQQDAIDGSLAELKEVKLTTQGKVLKGLSKWIQK